MLNEDEQITNSSPKSWLWSDCKLVLRRTNPDNLSEESYENLQAEVELECQQIPQPFIPIITFQKSFKQNQTDGYYWKKGTPLPTIVVKLQDSYFQLLKEDQQIIMIYCELTIAYPNRKQSHFYLEEVKSLGDKRKVFSDQGLAQFNGIILKESSRQNANNKFSLLFRICASSIQENRIILKTLISTAFYVLNSRIARKNRKSKLSMKLISPKKFLKPLMDLKTLESDFNKENILSFLKNCNKNARYLSLTHPLYMIYHYSDILKLYYNSREVTDLYELLQVIAPTMGEQHKFLNMKSSFVSYELKKTKKIRKNQENQENKKKNRQKLIIKTQIKQGLNPERKLLLVTFKQDLINNINHAIKMEKLQNQQSYFESQLQKQISSLTKMFEDWTRFYLEIDLLKEEPDSVYWKDIQKDKVYEAYSKHYQVTKNRLTSLMNEDNNAHAGTLNDNQLPNRQGHSY